MDEVAHSRVFLWYSLQFKFDEFSKE